MKTTDNKAMQVYVNGRIYEAVILSDKEMDFFEAKRMMVERGLRFPTAVEASSMVAAGLSVKGAFWGCAKKRDFGYDVTVCDKDGFLASPASRYSKYYTVGLR